MKMNTKCKSTDVQPCRKDSQTKIIVNDTVHAGIVTHECGLEEGHKEPTNENGAVVCVCICKNHRWVRNFK